MRLQPSTLFLTVLVHLLAVWNEIDASTDARDLELGVRLTGGASYLDGIIEMYRNGSWWLVCDDWFDERDARVICRMVGGAEGLPMYFTTVVNVDANPYENINGTFGYNSLGCNGTEVSVALCPYTRDFHCKHDEQVALKCHSKGGAQWTHPPNTTSRATMMASTTTTTMASASPEDSSEDVEEASMATSVRIVSGVLAAILVAAVAALVAMVLGRRKKGSESSSSPGSSWSGSSDWSESTL